MTEIILVRHGETKWNVEEVFRGRIDVELNETGIKQAELLGRYLSKRKIDAIYSSPLKRAVKTACNTKNNANRRSVDIRKAMTDGPRTDMKPAEMIDSMLPR